jgi:hypothetical protein
MDLDYFLLWPESKLRGSLKPARGGLEAGFEFVVEAENRSELIRALISKNASRFLFMVSLQGVEG